MVAISYTTLIPSNPSYPEQKSDVLPHMYSVPLRNDSIIGGWLEALRLHDQDTFNHAWRVSHMATQVAIALKLDDANVTAIALGALLHDIGKLEVPARIINKRDKLTDDDHAEMQEHPLYGYTLLQSLHSAPERLQVLDIVRHHHEKWDGSGYPDKLIGEKIGQGARICAVADVWDALCSPRPYRPAWSRSRTATYMRAHAGTHFDPEIVRVFLELQQSYENPLKQFWHTVRASMNILATGCKVGQET